MIIEIYSKNILEQTYEVPEKVYYMDFLEDFIERIPGIRDKTVKVIEEEEESFYNTRSGEFRKVV